MVHIHAETLERAFEYGTARAKSEKALDLTCNDEPCGGYNEQQDIIQHITGGEKIDPETDEGFAILDAYEDGYFAVWDDTED